MKNYLNNKCLQHYQEAIIKLLMREDFRLVVQQDNSILQELHKVQLPTFNWRIKLELRISSEKQFLADFSTVSISIQISNYITTSTSKKPIKKSTKKKLFIFYHFKNRSYPWKNIQSYRFVVYFLTSTIWSSLSSW